jgi:hypothetical protein
MVEERLIIKTIRPITHLKETLLLREKQVVGLPMALMREVFLQTS